MNEDDTAALASPSGILGCLRLLAEEAGSLNLPRTEAAINEALIIASRESSLVFPRRDDGWTPHDGSRVH